MNWKLIHLFPEAMSLYGEYANLAVLGRYLELLGDQVTVTPVTGADTPDFSGAHLIYMGCGTERTQKWALERLAPYADSLKEAAEGGALVLFTGNAMDILGASITDQKGKVWQGLGLTDFTTIETNQRTPHDVIAVSALWSAPAVGFLNKCSVTSGVTTPLFSSLTLGFGNQSQRGAEGYAAGNLLATHITGPVLVKNPAFLEYVAGRLYAAQGEQMGQVPAGQPWLDHAARAYQVTLEELTALAK